MNKKSANSFNKFTFKIKIKKIMKNLLLILTALFFVNLTSAQINAKLMRYMDVSDSQIVFVYGGDIWVVDKNGGTALSVTSSLGEESWPRFSPDGKSIAFTAQYNGNSDVFVMPVTGGIPTRVTFNAFSDRLIDWHPDGKKLLFASSREMGARGLSEFFMVEKVVEEVLKLTKAEKHKMTPAPPLEDRTAKGLR